MAKKVFYQKLEDGLTIGQTYVFVLPLHYWRPKWWKAYWRANASWHSIQIEETRKKLGGQWVRYDPPTKEMCSGMWFRKEDADKAHVPWAKHVGIMEDWD